MRISEEFLAFFWQNPTINNCNTYLIDGPNPLLIDPGHAAYANDLATSMQQDGVQPEKLALIINTHAHPDHMEANSRFDHPGLLYALHRDEEKFIETVGRTLFLQMGSPMPEYRIDFYLQEGDLTINDQAFTIIHTPGHSPGSICLYWHNYSVLFSGDLIFANGVGRVDLPGGDRNQLKASIEKVSSLPIENIFPGHGPPLTGKAKVEKYLKNLSDYVAQYL